MDPTPNRYPNNELIQSLLSADHKSAYGSIVKKVETYMKDQSSRDQQSASDS